MSLNQLFVKDIHRNIEGVIKADDAEDLLLELDEYVFTNEVEKRLESFLDAYINYGGANGVWISGFFGSGKSHLLKMLALVLENHTIEGLSALDLILPKCQDNEILRGQLKRAVDIPSSSILFNIDQKADVISKSQIDALLTVFQKVFDEHCGYYGKQGHIAEFERALNARDLFTKFKEEFQRIAELPWEQGREQAVLESRNIDSAYAAVSGANDDDARNVIKQYREQYKVSIEDFADKVNQYIESQGKDFRLNFFVDEVGQYIADNTKLMTNLQTIAESLATKCRGRAWLIVTSQNEMDDLLGGLSQQQSNDFSKIMGRFANKMLLTSTNVAEVIQRRLLQKTDEGAAQVSDLFHHVHNDFGTLFTFTDGSKSYKVYRDMDEFVRCYPFVPYQFELFQAAIENLSRHGAFEGKHSSVGERSMLGVFQTVAKQIGGYDLGQIASFDLMYEGISTAIKAQTQSSIKSAENYFDDDPFTVQLLKAMFLVKYVKPFKASIHNLCILMQESFGQDLDVLRKQVETSLNLLEQQSYVKRLGDLYEFLTDEEKDVEKEIKNTDVDTNEVAAELEKILFDGVIKDRKIRCSDNDQDFSFSRKLDDRVMGREHELSVHIVTPLNEHIDHEQTLLNQAFGRDEMLVVLPNNDRLIRDLLMYKRTEKYIRLNTTQNQQDSTGRILLDKGQQNADRIRDIQDLAKRMLSQARIFVDSKELEIKQEDAQSRVRVAFQSLIQHCYPNLRMLRDKRFNENDVRTALNSLREGLFGEENMALPEPEQELLSQVRSNQIGGVRTSIKQLLERFEKKPYGWSFYAILTQLANLYSRGKVELRRDSELLESGALLTLLTNTQAHGSILVEPQAEFSQAEVRRLKDFYEEMFDAPAKASEPKALGTEVGRAVAELHQELSILESKFSTYPFLVQLRKVISTLEEVKGKTYSWYLQEIANHHDELLDLKESLVDPIKSFMAGSQRAIFDEIRAFVASNKNNFDYIDADEVAALNELLTNPNCFRGGQMQQGKQHMQSLQTALQKAVEDESKRGKADLADLKAKLTGEQDYQIADSAVKDQIQHVFNEMDNQLNQLQEIPLLREALRRFKETEYRKILTMLAPAQPMSSPIEPGAKSDDTPAEPPSPALPEYTSMSEVSVNYNRAWIDSPEDLNDYIESLKQALEKELKEGKRIQL